MLITAGVVRYVKHRVFCTASFFGKISTAKNTTALLRWSVKIKLSLKIDLFG